MTWTWRLADAGGQPVELDDLGLVEASAENQGDAESWLGEHWRDLVAGGVSTATLLDGDRQVYGPMSLAET